MLAVALVATAGDLVWGLSHAATPPLTQLPLLAVGLAGGWSFVVSGLFVRARRPMGGTGGLMAAVGLCLLLSGVNYLPERWALLTGNVIGWLALTLLAHVVLIMPEGRAVGRRQRATVLVLYLGMAQALAVWLRFGRLGDGSCTCLPLLPGGEDVSRPLIAAVAVFLWLFGLGMTAMLGWRWLVRLPAPRRHTFAPVALAGGLMLLTTWTRQAVYIWPDATNSLLQAVLHGVQLLTLATWPLGVLAGLMRARLDQAAVARLATGLDLSPGALEKTLASVLRDPTLRLGYWTGDGYVDAAGDPLTVPGTRSASVSGDPLTVPGTRSAAYLEVGGEPAAVLLYDPALDLDPEPVRSVAAITRLIVENERMRAELAAQLVEVRASRARIVAAGDAERSRIERNLHDGAQQRLAGLAVLLGHARLRNADAEVAELLDEAVTGVRAALAELRELAGGIHPAILSQSGLAAALHSLAERSPVPAVVEEAPDGRLPPDAEQAAYFVAAEALANVAKHADASKASIRAVVRDGVLLLEVTDDGTGGARPESGTGLRGLADRVAALDGLLHVHSPPGQGTRVTAEIPLAGQERK
ncbi:MULTISPECIES: sensor histidine kinase [unclassified Nonomuraea]|uniref:sensor histidine kinase n=1 Tax=unclassified Nonomuraea TaxID=2593643 RepID=UPI0033D0F19F